MAEYRLTETGMVVRTADGAFIPPDEGNADWQAYQAWLADGGVPDPVTQPIVATLDSVGTGKTTNQILGAV